MPFRSTTTEQLLQGQPVTDQLLAQAREALRAELQPEPDLAHSVAAKRHLAGVMLKRCMTVLREQTSSVNPETV